jgi:hypothetical protein
MCKPGKENNKQYQYGYHKHIPAIPVFEQWYLFFCLQAVKLRVNINVAIFFM